MNGNKIVLDTSEAIALLNNTANAGAWIAGFSAVYLPVPVAGELRFGALNSKRANENRSRVDALVARCGILDVTAATTEVYATVRMALKRMGKPIPENDVWIASLCIQHGLPLATADEHFSHVEELEVIQR